MRMCAKIENNSRFCNSTLSLQSRNSSFMVLNYLCCRLAVVGMYFVGSYHRIYQEFGLPVWDIRRKGENLPS